MNCLLADAALVLNGHFPVGQTSSKGFRQLATDQYFLCLAFANDSIHVFTLQARCPTTNIKITDSCAVQEQRQLQDA